MMIDNQTLYKNYKEQSQIDWFFEAQSTRQLAQDLHNPVGFFDPAAVFVTPQDDYVMGRIRGGNWSAKHIENISQNILELTGCQMVSICDPLLNIWKDKKDYLEILSGGNK